MPFPERLPKNIQETRNLKLLRLSKVGRTWQKSVLKTLTLKEEKMDSHLTYSEVAQLLGLKPGTLYSLVSRKRIPHIKLGKRLVRFPRRLLLEWIERKLVLPEPEARTVDSGNQKAASAEEGVTG